MRDAEVVRGALEGIDSVVHLAAASASARACTSPPIRGREHDRHRRAARGLLDHPVRKLVVASSMSVYGEGAYEPGPATERTREQLERGEWEPRGPTASSSSRCRRPRRRPALASIYALTKYDQERMCLLFGTAYDVPAVALRFFNVYGPRQALSNPYTGVAAIFGSRLFNGQPPVVFEDGRQRRDFVHVARRRRACRLTLEKNGADDLPVNVGSGRSSSVLEIAEALARVLGKQIEPELPGKFRASGIRHCFANVTRARARGARLRGRGAVRARPGRACRVAPGPAGDRPLRQSRRGVGRARPDDVLYDVSEGGQPRPSRRP